MAKIAIIGAGGKMGCRLTRNLRGGQHSLMLVEVSEPGRERIEKNGLRVTPQDEAVAIADAVILAVPDKLLGKIAADVVPAMASGAMLITLDPAAAHAGELPERDDISIFVTHPCHPNVFDHLETEAARADFFGGTHARQAIVCALMSGPEDDYAKGEQLAREFYAPVTRAHRVTVEQMAILEPTMAETCGIALVRALREAMEEAVACGVPRAAAEDFMFGHIRVLLGIGFSRVDFPFSDGANLIANYGRTQILRGDWKDLFKPESVLEQTRMIVRGEEARSTS